MRVDCRPFIDDQEVFNSDGDQPPPPSRGEGVKGLLRGLDGGGSMGGGQVTNRGWRKDRHTRSRDNLVCRVFDDPAGECK